MSDHHHPHGHALDHHHGVDRTVQRRALWLSLTANSGFLVVEVIGGVVLHSLSLLADAAHMFSDVAGLAIALVAQRLVDRPATAKHSYGLQRAEVLGAQANGVALVAVAAWIIYEAVQRIGDPADVRGGGLLVVATVGLAINVGSAVLLGRASGRSLNMRGAYLHMVMDAIGSIGVIVAAVAVLIAGATWVDPVVSVGIALLVLWSAWGLLRDTAQVLLEGTPRGIEPAEIEAALISLPDVDAVHHLHVWNLASDVPALSAHVVLDGEFSLHEAQARGDALKHLVHERFGIEHATIELERHPCDAEPEAHASHHHHP